MYRVNNVPVPQSVLEPACGFIDTFPHFNPPMLYIVIHTGLLRGGVRVSGGIFGVQGTDVVGGKGYSH